MNSLTVAVVDWFAGGRVAFAMGLSLAIGRSGSFSADMSPTWFAGAYAAGWQQPLVIAATIAAIGMVAAIAYRGLDSKYRVAANGARHLHPTLKPQDLLRFGLIPELVGRLPVNVTLEPLDEEALVRILQEPKNALLKQYDKIFELEGIRLTFDSDAVREVARKALERGTGARGLRAVLESIMRDVMFEIPSREDVREVVVTPESVTDAIPPLLVLHPENRKKEA